MLHKLVITDLCVMKEPSLKASEWMSAWMSFSHNLLAIRTYGDEVD